MAERRCSFCDLPEDGVRMLIAGKSAFICDSCVAMAAWLIEDMDLDSPAGSEFTVKAASGYISMTGKLTAKGKLTKGSEDEPE